MAEAEEAVATEECSLQPDQLRPPVSDSVPVSSSSNQLKPAPPPDTVLMNISGTRYGVVSLVADELGIAVTEDNSGDCDLFWTDAGLGTEKFLGLKHYQFMNHFPGMNEISRKDSLGRNMEKLRKLHKEEYNFVPRTWILPAEYHSLSYHMRELRRKRKNKTFIIKPHNSAMGNGISLVRSLDDVHREQNVVVQEYLDKPFLLDSFKIDLRVYVLVTNCNPLRVFVYKDGLVRFSTQPYIPPTDSNLDKHFMHLTNYSINKHSDTFDSSEEVDRGSKRTLQFLNDWLSKHDYSVPELWAKIHDIIVKTLLVTSPHLVHSYQACRPGRSQDERSQFFEILGFDIFLDDQLTPWLLEVNRAPSFATESKLDLQVKTGVLKDALRIFNIKPRDKKKEMVAHRTAIRQRLSYTPTKCARYDFLAEQEGASYNLMRKKKDVKDRLDKIRREKEQLEHEQQSMGGYKRIYPSNDWAKDRLYKALLKSASAITLIGDKNHSRAIPRETSALDRMKEHELVDLLSQYEDEQKGGAANYMTYSSHSATFYQPLSMESSNPMDAVYRAMATRVAEEEQTQRIMIALNGMKPTYPGKSREEVVTVLEEMTSNLEQHLPNMASFWLTSLDARQRRQLLLPLKNSISSLLACYWRTDYLEGIRLNQIFKKLFNFLFSSGGRGLWTSFVPKEKTWEEQFKDRSQVISVIEMVCCRRIVQLCQATVKAAYYYHHLNHASTKPKKQRNASRDSSHSVQSASLCEPPISKTPSLPPSSKHRSQQHRPTALASASLVPAHPGSAASLVPAHPGPGATRSYQFSRRKRFPVRS